MIIRKKETGYPEITSDVFCSNQAFLGSFIREFTGESCQEMLGEKGEWIQTGNNADFGFTP